MRITIPSRIGFGTAPLGNMYRNIPDQEAIATVQAAWDSGIRYFDGDQQGFTGQCRRLICRNL